MWPTCKFTQLIAITRMRPCRQYRTVYILCKTSVLGVDDLWNDIDTMWLWQMQRARQLCWYLTKSRSNISTHVQMYPRVPSLPLHALGMTDSTISCMFLEILSLIIAIDPEHYDIIGCHHWRFENIPGTHWNVPPIEVHYEASHLLLAYRTAGSFRGFQVLRFRVWVEPWKLNPKNKKSSARAIRTGVAIIAG